MKNQKKKEEGISEEKLMESEINSNIEQQKIDQKQKNPYLKTDILITVQLGCGFMLFLSAYLAFLNMISQIYSQLNYDYLGNISIFCVYAAFGIGSLFSSYCAKLLDYKYIMAICSFVTCLNVFMGFLICECKENDYFYCSDGGIYSLVIIISSICGGFDATLWIAQGGYLNIILKRNPGKDGLFFGVFWGITQISSVSSMLIAYILLKYFTQAQFFLISTMLMALSALIFVLLPNLQKTTEQIREKKEKIQLNIMFKNMKKIMVMSISKNYFVFFAFGGCIISFISGVMHTLIEESLDSSLTDQEVNLRTTLVYICIGIFDSLTGISSGIINDKMKKPFSLFRISAFLAQFTFLITFVNYIAKSYLGCFIVGAFCGVSDCLFLNLSCIACSRDFQGRLEMFSYYKFFQGMAVAGSLGINLGLMHQSKLIFIGIMIFISVFASFGIFQMKQPGEENKQLLYLQNIYDNNRKQEKEEEELRRNSVNLSHTL